MILTDYYKFEHLTGTKSKTRIDCVVSTKEYPKFEGLRNKFGGLFIYVCDNTYIGGDTKRNADLTLSKSEHISSMYQPDIMKPYLYGDIKGTEDAILVRFTSVSFTNGGINEGGIVELFVARGKRHNRTQLYDMFADNEMDSEIIELSKRAVTESVTG